MFERSRAAQRAPGFGWRALFIVLGLHVAAWVCIALYEQATWTGNGWVSLRHILKQLAAMVLIPSSIMSLVVFVLLRRLKILCVVFWLLCPVIGAALLPTVISASKQRSQQGQQGQVQVQRRSRPPQSSQPKSQQPEPQLKRVEHEPTTKIAYEIQRHLRITEWRFEVESPDRVRATVIGENTLPEPFELRELRLLDDSATLKTPDCLQFVALMNEPLLPGKFSVAFELLKKVPRYESEYVDVGVCPDVGDTELTLVGNYRETPVRLSSTTGGRFLHAAKTQSGKLMVDGRFHSIHPRKLSDELQFGLRFGWRFDVTSSDRARITLFGTNSLREPLMLRKLKFWDDRKKLCRLFTATMNERLPQEKFELSLETQHDVDGMVDCSEAGGTGLIISGDFREIPIRLSSPYKPWSFRNVRTPSGELTIDGGLPHAASDSR